MSEPTTVVSDDEKNRFFKIYLSSLAVVGTGIIVCTVLLDWGGWGYFGGGFLLVAGAGGLLGNRMTGGAGLARCPNCRTMNKLLHISEHRYLKCGGCGTWLEGAETMSVVPPERIAETPSFEVPIPSGEIHWPDGCPACTQPATRMITIEGRDMVGTAAIAAAGVGLQKVHKIRVPACDRHDDGIWLRITGGNPELAFRSMGYLRRFLAANPMGSAESPPES